MHSSPSVGIVVAMAAEDRHILSIAEDRDPFNLGGFPAFHFRLGAATCALVRSGIGMVHAAAATQAMIMEEHPSIVVNFGCAGAHLKNLQPGDIVLANQCVYHAAVQIQPDGQERYVGFTQELGSDIANVNENAEVPTDPRLLERAVFAASQTRLPAWPGSAHEPAIIVGPIASADVWTQSVERLEAIHAFHGTFCEDMEAAAVGRISHLHGIPFLSVKDISNNEFHRASDLTDFTDFPVEEVGKRAAIVVAQMIRELDDPARQFC
ncbi:5'-methylthioadenosine/S-adenosylhomocysteine nucleosidase [soil metagenome]